jgi:hypothetical protein
LPAASRSTTSIDNPSIGCAHFATLIRGRGIDVDSAPLQLVADAFLCGRRVEVEPFIE